MTSRLRIYRNLQKLLATLIIRRGKNPEGLIPTAALPHYRNLIWFHAASAGELESLAPLIQTHLGKSADVIVTIFSSSAEKGLSRLNEDLKDMPGRILYSGKSPWEGYWLNSLRKWNLKAFVTTKYEAWPELWASLGYLGIPLFITGARSRSSLSLAKRVCRILGTPLPVLVFLCTQEQDRVTLSAEFPSSRTFTVGDPRWDRIEWRAQGSNPRLKGILDFLRECPRPWGILGQVWLEDLSALQIKLNEFLGTLWIVPHSTDLKIKEAFIQKLNCLGVSYKKTSILARSPDSPPRVVLVDEIGILLELYQYADWAYVGGGFSNGVHSTMEPAFFGIPVAAGKKGAVLFPEIEELVAQKQLTLISDAEGWRQWIRLLSNAPDESQKSLWKSEARQRLGATERIYKEILDLFPITK